MASLMDLLAQTWPARMGQAAWQAFKAPGDAYAGRLDPLSDEGIGRATDLAGMVMGGTFATAPRGALGAGPGIRAYHGSPYDFERFDLSKIGTGEGAQAYGHGLYFAEHEPVAASYKNAMRVTDMDWPVVGGSEGGKVPAWVGRHASASPFGLDEMISEFSKRAREMEAEKHWNVQGIRNIVDDLQAVKAGKAEIRKPGHMYEVNIRAEPEQFVQWDKDLAQQPSAVQKFAAENFEPGTYVSPNRIARYSDIGSSVYPSPTGAELYQSLERHYGRGSLTSGKPTASDLLREAGIPGIRYLDQGSRSGGQGTSNYVLFRDDIIDILRKYGLAGLAATGTAGAAVAPTSKQPQSLLEM